MFEPVQFNPLIRLSCYQGVELATTRSTNAAKPILSCVHLCACSIETFSSFAISVQGFRCVTIRYVRSTFNSAQCWFTPLQNSRRNHPSLWVNGGPIRYGFRVGARAILYRVSMGLSAPIPKKVCDWLGKQLGW